MSEAPTPIAAPKAAERFINGNVIANPDIAIAPTPCPMKMESTILYSDDAVIAMIAGIAYCMSSFPTGFVPNSNVACLLSISFFCKVTKKTTKQQ